MQTASRNLSSPRRIWIGRSIVAIAIFHTVAGLALFSPALGDIVQRGVFNSINHDPVRGVATWFMLFGGPLALTGMCIDSLERQPAFPMAKATGWGFLLTCVLGVVLMPASGFWLAFPPAIALIMWRQR